MSSILPTMLDRILRWYLMSRMMSLAQSIKSRILLLGVVLSTSYLNLSLISSLKTFCERINHTIKFKKNNDVNSEMFWNVFLSAKRTQMPLPIKRHLYSVKINRWPISNKRTQRGGAAAQVVQALRQNIYHIKDSQ